MDQRRVGVLEGDGIGPEIVPPTLEAMAAAVEAAGGDQLEFDRLPSGWRGLEEHGTTLPQVTVDALAERTAWVVGPHDSSGYPPEWVRALSPHARLRRDFTLYANIRPARNLPGVASVVDGLDVVVLRENSEGFYADNAMAHGSAQLVPAPGVALCVGVFTDAAARRIAGEAFRLARTRRGRVTVVHKALLGATLGRYLEVAREVSAQYPDVELDDVHVDAATVHLVRDPSRFDVLLTENMHGDILSDLAGELAGALGLTPSINVGAEHAMAQAAHGCAPDIAGRGIANPVGMLRSAALLLGWLATRTGDERDRDAADRLDGAVLAELAAGRGTGDLGGDDTTAGFAGAVREAIREGRGAGGPGQR